MKVYVAIPTVSSLNINPHPRLLKWLQGQGLVPDFVDNFMPQWEARNEIVRCFLESGAEILQMHDCDTVPTWKRNDLWEQNLCLVVAGYYAMFTNEPMFQWSVGKLKDKNPIKSLYQFAVRIPREVSFWDVCGFGCIRLPRFIVEELWNRKKSEGIFHPTFHGVTEDVPVCEQLRKIGYEIVTDSSLKCEHWRTIDISAQLDVQNSLIDAHKIGE